MYRMEVFSIVNYLLYMSFVVSVFFISTSFFEFGYTGREQASRVFKFHKVRQNVVPSSIDNVKCSYFCILCLPSLRCQYVLLPSVLSVEYLCLPKSAVYKYFCCLFILFILFFFSCFQCSSLQSKGVINLFVGTDVKKTDLDI